MSQELDRGGDTQRESEAEEDALERLLLERRALLAQHAGVSLSNWTVSINEVFDGWPSNFTVVAVDAAQNKPYILTRGPSIPTSKEQCKRGGCRNFGVLKNQGDCVSFVATGGKNPPAGRRR